ncbi:MAG: hypothetical protein MI923_11055, partial [Phycisphaerales bacterium]|nr:hypothetical protein [Phycisphaerales bacterium]
TASPRASSMPICRSRVMALPAAPTPGRISRSATRTSSAVRAICGSPPVRTIMLASERRFPAS